MAAPTQADIDNLNSAIASGVRSVTNGGQTVTYSTVDALIKARDDLQALFNKANADPQTARRRQLLGVHSGRGF